MVNDLQFARIINWFHLIYVALSQNPQYSLGILVCW